MPDNAEAQKLNPALLQALRTWRQSDDPDPNDGITVTLRFEGDLAAIEALGFETHASTNDEATGVVRFKDIPALVAHPGVLWLAAGGRRKSRDTAVPDIKARVPLGGGTLGTDGLWQAVVATGVLTQIGPDHATGEGVIVAVIDTGIDIQHPMFMKQLVPTKQTRIKRIWDQGIAPTALAQCPDQTLMSGPGRYGREFTDADIDAALNVGPMIDHKDCEGHGTHVAGIAAGGTFFPPGGDATFVGVAPQADIIVVKHLDVPDVVRFRTAAGFGAQVDWDRRFKDAVLYCLRTARILGKPVVINQSFGGSEPGDALDDQSRWVDDLMDPAHAADPNHFPSGAVMVRSAGNDGDVSDRTFARVVVPPSGEIVVPFELRDRRGGVNNKFKVCANSLHNPDLTVTCWYRRNFDNVKFAVKLPNRTVFEGGGDMGVGGNFRDGYLVRPGVPPRLVNIGDGPRRFIVDARHHGEPAVPHPAGGTVRRHSFTLNVTPKTSGGVVTYLDGIYEIRVRAPPATEVFMAGDEADWGDRLLVTFAVASAMADGSALDPAVTAAISPEFTIVDALGKNAVSVAAYNDADHKLADFSSRGPLRDFSDPPGSKPLVASKPDIGAPGVAIKSAQGIDTNVGVGVRTPPWLSGIRFIEEQGTSMAAPMIAGVIALMLHKNAGLNTTQVQTILATAPRPGTNPVPPGPTYERAYGAGMVDALDSHNHS